MKKRVLLSLLIGFLYVTISAQSAYRSEIYDAFVKDDMSLWVSTLEDMKVQYQETGAPELLYDIATSEYGLTGYFLGQEEKERASAYLESLEDHLDILMESEHRIAAAYAIKAATIGFYIGLSPAKAIYLGPRNARYIKRSMEADSTEPMAWIEGGNSLFYRPAIFGGSKEEALAYFLKAARLFEEKDQDDMNWIYLNTFILQAMCYLEAEQYDRALAIYEELLVKEPGFKWVKDELYPEARRKMQ